MSKETDEAKASPEDAEATKAATTITDIVNAYSSGDIRNAIQAWFESGCRLESIPLDIRQEMFREVMGLLAYVQQNPKAPLSSLLFSASITGLMAGLVAAESRQNRRNADQLINNRETDGQQARDRQTDQVDLSIVSPPFCSDFGHSYTFGCRRF